MGAGVSEAKIRRELNKLAKANPGVEYRVLRASNGEVAIVSERYYQAATTNPLGQLGSMVR
jgi:hypothetical protein